MPLGKAHEINVSIDNFALSHFPLDPAQSSNARSIPQEKIPDKDAYIPTQIVEIPIYITL
jgi:hypothetical protein